MPNGPLHGIRVLEFSQIVAGPASGIHLSDLGADVVKVEPPGGEGRRNTGAIVPNEGKFFQTLNRGKRSLVVDLQQPEGQELIHRIIPGFDVVTINYRIGVPERLGIDYETLSSIKPDLIYANISGFGERGPEKLRAGSDIVAQAYTGLMFAEMKTDESGAPASITSSTYADRGTGLAAALGVCAALYHRAQTGEGQLIQTSLLQTGLDYLAPHVAREPLHDATVRDPMVERLEEMKRNGESYEEITKMRRASNVARASHRLYYGGYNTKDGAIVLGALTKTNRDAMRRVLGIEEEPSDGADFDSNAPENVVNAEKWKGVIAEKMLTRTSAEWVADFDRAGAPCSEVHYPEQMADDPQVQAMGMMADLEHEITGPQRFVGPLVRLSRTPTAARLPAPVLGRHSREVLAEGGYSDEEIEALRKKGVIV